MRWALTIQLIQHHHVCQWHFILEYFLQCNSDLQNLFWMCKVNRKQLCLLFLHTHTALVCFSIFPIFASSSTNNNGNPQNIWYFHVWNDTCIAHTIICTTQRTEQLRTKNYTHTICKWHGMLITWPKSS